MSTYSVTQVANLTGIKAHTLRIWERRYSFLRPERTDTNIRLYSDPQLRKLLNVGILIRNGYKISTIDKLEDQQVDNLVTEILASPTKANDDYIDGLTLAMLELDEVEFDYIFQTHVIRNGLTETIVKLIYPFLHHIALLWTTNKLIPAQEHFVSNLIKQKIIAAIDNLPNPTRSAPGIVLFLPEGETHEIGLLLAYYLAKDLGWKVYYLGQNVPVENINSVLKIVEAKIMMTMTITSKSNKLEKYMDTLLAEVTTPLLFSGAIQNFENSEYFNEMLYMISPTDLTELLKENI